MHLPVAPYPFLRLALFFTSGIAAFVHFQIFIDQLEWIVTGLSAIFLLVFVIHFKQNKNEAIGRCLLAYALCFFFGALICKWDTEILDPAHFSNFNKQQTAYLAIVDDELIEKPKSVSTRLRVKFVFQDGNWMAAKGNVLVYFSPDSICSKLRYGDWLVVNGKPNPTESPKNPGEFDYKRFLTFKNIYHQHFIKTGEWAWLRNEPSSLVWKFAFEAREAMSKLMQSVMGGGQEFAVASMLVLGIRQTIDFELFQAYSAAGAIHILAVSGMHVGLVFALIQLLLGRLACNRSMSHLFYGLSLLAIWAFGMITAFSPSVLRAVVMFNVIIVAKWTGRKGNLFNTLGFSAFAILLESPYTLMSVGFQMSFMAVVGIAYFQPRILKLLSPQNRLIKFIWEITCVSIAAQITTFPLALFYFKQFPTYFLLSNLWVIPASTIILYVGIAFFVGSFLMPIKMSLGWLLKISVLWLNKSMFMVMHLPKPVLRTDFFDGWEIVVLYSLVLLLVLLFKLKDRRYLLVAIILSVAFSCSRIVKEGTVNSRNSILVYSIQKTICLAAIQGNRARVFANKDFLENKSAFEFHVLNSLKSAGVNDITFQAIPRTNFSWNRGETKILVFQQENMIPKHYSKLAEADYVFLSASCTKMLDITQNHTYKNVILQVDKYDKPLKSKSNVWNLQANGALELDLAPDGKYYIRNTR